MKLDPEEKDYIEKIASVTGENINTVKNVMRGLLMQAGLQARAGNKTFVVPYICRINFRVRLDVVDRRMKILDKVRLLAEPTTVLAKELISIPRKTPSPVKQWFKKRITEKITSLLKNG